MRAFMSQTENFGSISFRYHNLISKLAHSSFTGTVEGRHFLISIPSFIKIAKLDHLPAVSFVRLRAELRPKSSGSFCCLGDEIDVENFSLFRGDIF